MTETRAYDIYGITIERRCRRWQITYHYNNTIGSFTLPSLKKAEEWCRSRNLKYEVK